MRERWLQRGLTTVEFAIVGSVLFILIFATLEFGRVIFTMNVLQEAARRGARVAAVSHYQDTVAVTNAVRFMGLPTLQQSAVGVSYLNTDGGNADGFDAVQYVQVSVDAPDLNVGIPYVYRGAFSLPVFTSTLPRESLGVLPPD